MVTGSPTSRASVYGLRKTPLPMVVPTMTARPPQNPMTRGSPSPLTALLTAGSIRGPRAAGTRAITRVRSRPSPPAGLFQDLQRRRAEILHDQAAPRGRPPHVGDVRVQRLPQGPITLAHAVGQRAGPAEEHPALEIGVLRLGRERRFQTVHGGGDPRGPQRVRQLAGGD